MEANVDTKNTKYIPKLFHRKYISKIETGHICMCAKYRLKVSKLVWIRQKQFQQEYIYLKFISEKGQKIQAVITFAYFFYD